MKITPLFFLTKLRQDQLGKHDVQRARRVKQKHYNKKISLNCSSSQITTRQKKSKFDLRSVDSTYLRFASSKQTFNKKNVTALRPRRCLPCRLELFNPNPAGFSFSLVRRQSIWDFHWNPWRSSTTIVSKYHWKTPQFGDTILNL